MSKLIEKSLGQSSLNSTRTQYDEVADKDNREASQDLLDTANSSFDTKEVKRFKKNQRSFFLIKAVVNIK